MSLIKEELEVINAAFTEGAFAGARYAVPQMGMVVS